MFHTTLVRRALLASHHHGVTVGNNIRCVVSSLPTSSATTTTTNHQQQQQVQQQQRYVHATRRDEQDAVEATAVAPVIPIAEKKAASTLYDRFVVTAEVTVSKIFPAGFGWQMASVFAGQQGLASDSMNFALSTGLGDAIGVFAGHCMYYGIKKNAVNAAIDMNKEMQTGLLLGTAAFCSGTAWQPIVNALQGANLPFNQVFLGTWVGCGTAFYVGLRIARTLLSGPFKHIHEPTYENGRNDVSLSMAIGGATGFFVGTDAAYLPHENFLLPIVGIKPGTPDLVGCAIAGSSTALGFVTAQSAFNVAYPRGKLWND